MQIGSEIMKAAAEQSIHRQFTDAERAEEYRRRLVEAHKPVFAILDEARAAGFEINFSSSPGPDGKMVVQQVRVMKVL